MIKKQTANRIDIPYETPRGYRAAGILSYYSGHQYASVSGIQVLEHSVVMDMWCDSGDYGATAFVVLLFIRVNVT